MLTIYLKQEQPDGLLNFASMNPSLAAREGLLLWMARHYGDASVAVVIDDVCADAMIYEGAPFVGPRLPASDGVHVQASTECE